MRKLACWILLLALAVPAFALASGGSAQITGTAFLDNNGNGVFDEGERTLSDVEVSLMQSAGGAETIAAVFRTDGDGAFSFAQVPTGDYYLKALLPDGFYFAAMTEGGSAMLPASGQGSRTLPIALNDGQSAHVLVGVIRQPSYITIYAFGDLNGNGGRMSNEPLLRNVLLELLYDTPEQTFVVGSATTNADGIAQIRDLSPGTYRLKATLPEPYVVGPLGAKINTFYNTILPSENNTGASAPFDIPFKGSAGLGVGGVETGRAEGSVWLDKNMNGLREADEPGFAGAAVTLTHRTLGVTRTATSGTDGAYAFANLQEGEYLLTVTVPEGHMFTLPGDSLFSDGYKLSGNTTLTVAIRQTATVQAVGVMPATSLVVSAFHDQNVNGIKDEGEPMFAGAGVTVTAGGQQVAQATTDANGVANFPLLRGGELTVRMTLPDGQIFTIGGEGGNAFVSTFACSDLSTPYTLAHGTQGNLLAGVTLPASISGSLFDDTNMDSRHDQTEEPLAGFTVQAVNASDEVVVETETDDLGAYTLASLIPGTYRVRVPLIPPYIFSDAAADGVGNQFVEQTPEHGQTAEVVLTAAQAKSGVDGALFRSAVVEGVVLLGDESDGFAGDRGGLAGAQVVLLNEDGAEVSEYTHAVTDASGAFLLKGALPGTYKLAYKLPQGSLFSAPYLEEPSFVTEALTLEAGASMQADPVFAVLTGSVSGVVYVDNNDNGVLDDADTRYPDASITMTMTELGLISQAVSDADGAYALKNLRPGHYAMDIQLSDGMLIAYGETSPATPALSSSATAELTVDMGQEQPDLDIAAVPSRRLSGRAFYDNDLSRTDSEGDAPRDALDIKLRHELSKIEFTAQSGADGGFSLDKVFPGAYTMVLSLPKDHELYAPRGAHQEGSRWSVKITLAAEPEAETPLAIGLVQFGSLAGQVWNMGGGMEDVGKLSVALYREGEAAAIASATTDPSGAYQFDRLYPGTYHIGVILPEGYRFARTLDTSVRDSLITSDASPVSGLSGQSNPFAVLMGETKIAQDVGMGKMGQLGDFAWLDLDGDGMQDMDEPGVPGIVIRLYQHGQLAAETETDPYGRYLFATLYPGTYTLQAVMPAELTTTKQQTEFPLVASILPEAQGTTAVAEGVRVPSGGRNLNADLGFALRDGKTLPASMVNLPRKDWTPYTDVVPTR